MAEILEIKVKASGIEEAYKGIENLTNALKELKKVYAGGNWLKEMASAFQTIGNAMSNATKGSAGKKEKPKFSPDEELGKKYENLSKRELLQKKLAASRGKLYDMAGQKPIDDGKLAEQASKVQRLKKELADLNKEAKQSTNPFRKLSSTLSSLGRAIGRIILYRAIRAAIKAIVDAFKEGLQNAYHFSKGINGSLAQALDTISTKSQTMKNQLGAAFGSLIQAVAPILLKIINLVTRAANAIAQLFAAFNGGTYLKAKDSFKEWAESAGAGAAATEEWKNQLMGFDEINRLDEPTSSGGGGGGTNYADMFEVTDVAENFLRITARIKEIAEPFAEDIKRIFGGIGDFIKGSFLGDWDLAFSGIADILEGCENLLTHFEDLFSKLVDRVTDKLDSLSSYFELKLPNALGMFFSSVIDGAKNLVDMVSSYILTMIEVVKFVIGFVKEIIRGFVSGDWTTAMQNIKDKWNDMLTNLMSLSAKHLGAIKALFANLLNSVISIINGIISGIGKLFGRSWGGIGYVSVPKYATGGTPEDGLFYANHNELVGQFSNGKTAVANNEQIISGIRQGVYEATLAAINNGNLPTAQDVRESRSDFYLDGKMISKSLNKYSRAMGT